MHLHNHDPAPAMHSSHDSHHPHAQPDVLAAIREDLVNSREWVSPAIVLVYAALAGGSVVGFTWICDRALHLFSDWRGAHPWIPFLLTLFFFILFNNLFEFIPGWQMPGNARMAMPLFMALLVWVVFNVVGLIKQGPLHYLKSVLFPPGVPIFLYVLVTPIEFVSTFLVRPFSLAVRLFANLLAGHILLVTFAILSAAMWSVGPSLVILPLPALVLILLTAFEVMVAFLQAYIFTILTAVYIGGAIHPEH